MLAIEAFLTSCLVTTLRWRTLWRWLSTAALLLALSVGSMVWLGSQTGASLTAPDDLSSWLQDLIRARIPIVPWTAGLVGLVAALFFQGVWIQGGLVEEAFAKSSLDSRTFYGAGGALAGRMLAIAAVFLVGLVGWGKLLGEFWIWLETDPPYDGALTTAHDPAVVIFALIGGIKLLLFLDLATCALVAPPGSSVVSALGRTARLWLRRVGSIATLVLLESALLVALIWAAVRLTPLLPEMGGESTRGSLIVTFLLLIAGWFRLQVLTAAGVLFQRAVSTPTKESCERKSFQGYSALPPTDIRDI